MYVIYVGVIRVTDVPKNLPQPYDSNVIKIIDKYLICSSVCSSSFMKITFLSCCSRTRCLELSRFYSYAVSFTGSCDS